MSYKKIVIVLSDIGNRHRVVKMSGCFDGKSNVTVECKSASARGVGTLYVLGDKIYKIELQSDKTEYKLPIESKSDILCALDQDGVLQVGGTGNVPSFRAVGERIKFWEKSLQTANKEAAVKDVEKEKDIASDKEKIADPEKEKCNAEPKEKSTNEKLYEQSVSGGDYVDIVEDLPEDYKGVFDREREKRNGYGYGQHEPMQRPESKYKEPTSRAEKYERDMMRRDKSQDEDAASKKHVRANRADNLDESGRVSAAADVMTGGVDYVGDNFYFAIKPQLDEMFVCYPEEKTLNSTVPNSRWVKVDTSDGYYVVGLIYDLETVLYICYGIPSMFSTLPPPEIADVCVWLPLNLNNREGDGYWVIYQSAVDGKCVR